MEFYFSALKDANTNNPVLPNEIINTNDVSTTFGETSETFTKLINKSCFKYQVTFYALFEQERNVANSDNKTFFINDVYFNTIQKKILSLGEVKKINIRSELQPNIEIIQLNGSGFGFEELVSMVITFSRTERTVGSSFVDLPYYHSQYQSTKS